MNAASWTYHFRFVTEWDDPSRGQDTMIFTTNLRVSDVSDVPFHFLGQPDVFEDAVELFCTMLKGRWRYPCIQTLHFPTAYTEWHSIWEMLNTLQICDQWIMTDGIEKKGGCLCQISSEVNAFHPHLPCLLRVTPFDNLLRFDKAGGDLAVKLGL